MYVCIYIYIYINNTNNNYIIDLAQSVRDSLGRLVVDVRKAQKQSGLQNYASEQIVLLSLLLLLLLLLLLVLLLLSFSLVLLLVLTLTWLLWLLLYSIPKGRERDRRRGQASELAHAPMGVPGRRPECRDHAPESVCLRLCFYVYVFMPCTSIWYSMSMFCVYVLYHLITPRSLDLRLWAPGGTPNQTITW